MPYYRSAENEVFYFDIAPTTGTVRPDLVEMTDAEIEAFNSQQPSE